MTRLRLILLGTVVLAIAGCDRPRSDDAVMADYEARENAAAAAAIEQEMNAIAAIRANVSAQALADEMLQAEIDAAAANAAMADIPIEPDNADEEPVMAPHSPAPPPSAADLNAADAAVKAAMDRRRARQ